MLHKNNLQKENWPDLGLWFFPGGPVLTLGLQTSHLLRYFDLCWLRSTTADLVYFKEFYFKKLLTFKNLIGTICTQKKNFNAL